MTIMIKELRNFILFAIITIVISNQQDNDQLSSKSFNDIQQLEQALHEASQYMTNKAKNQDAAVCLGTTRAGKSTLINYLIGNKLIGKKLTRTKPITVQIADNSTGPEIGIGSTSKTKIPSRWNLKRFPGLGIWDTPGFDDNRGSVQDITNAFYIYHLFKNVKSMKIVLVTDINDIANDNVGPFLSLLKSIENLFRHRLKECFSSTTVIFTKVPDVLYDNVVNKNFINDLLKEQFLSNSNISMSQPLKDFISFLINNNQNFGFFKKVMSEGEITESSIDNGIVQAIESTNSLQENILRSVSPSISQNSKLFLYDIRNQLSSADAFQNLLRIIRNIFNKKFNYLNIMENDKTTLNAFNEKLAIFENKIQVTFDQSVDLPGKIKFLQEMDPSIEELVNEHRLIEKADFMRFVDSLLDLKESNQFDLTLQSIMIKVMSDVQNVKLKIKLKLGQIDKDKVEAISLKLKEEAEKRIENLTNELEKLRIHNEMAARRAGFFTKIGNFLDELFL